MKKYFLFFSVLIIPIGISFHHQVPLFSNKPGEVSFYFREFQDDLKYIICKSIKEGKKNLLLSSFSFNDKQVASLLYEKEQEGLTIDLYIDAKQTNVLPKNRHYNIHAHDGRGLMHKKILAIDSSLLLLGSTNLTLTSLKLHQNLLIAIKSPPLFEAIVSSSFYTDRRITYYPLPEMGKEALTALIRAIDEAQKRIFVAIYTITHPKISHALIQAKKRGLDVRIYVDKGMARNTSKKILQTLVQNGIFVKTPRSLGLFHHKSALIDDVFVSGSANWTKAAFQKNQETLLFFTSLPSYSLKKLEKFFRILEIQGDPFQ